MRLGCGRLWSTGARPRPVRGGPRHEGPIMPRGVEAREGQQAGGPCHAPEGSVAGAGVSPKGLKRPVHRPAASLGRPRQWPSSAPLHPPSPSTGLPHPAYALCACAGLTGRRGALSGPARRSSSSGGGRRRGGCRRLRGASRAPDGNARSSRGDGGKNHDLSSSPSRPGCCNPALPLGARIRPESRVFWLEAGRLSGNERAPTPAAASARSPGHAGPARWW